MTYVRIEVPECPNRRRDLNDHMKLCLPHVFHVDLRNVASFTVGLTDEDALASMLIFPDCRPEIIDWKGAA